MRPARSPPCRGDIGFTSGRPHPLLARFATVGEPGGWTLALITVTFALFWLITAKLHSADLPRLWRLIFEHEERGLPPRGEKSPDGGRPNAPDRNRFPFRRHPQTAVERPPQFLGHRKRQTRLRVRHLCPATDRRGRRRCSLHPGRGKAPRTRPLPPARSAHRRLGRRRATEAGPVSSPGQRDQFARTGPRRNLRRGAARRRRGRAALLPRARHRHRPGSRPSGQIFSVVFAG